MPVELVFDQGFGDLFIVRVAGRIVAHHRAPGNFGKPEKAGVGTSLQLLLEMFKLMTGTDMFGHHHCQTIKF